MAYQALYREWRPKVFDEVVEQKHAVFALRQAVISGQIAHAYLFSGTRGTGKTTLAKIFARAINCLDPHDGNPCNQCAICRGMLDGSLLDVVEMDAASNNSVDNIRRICDEVVFMPSQARYKVYIIDEVHMLSTGAFNALLKTLEEPPAHAVFILATTEPHRIPATILSRCQRYEFRRIPVAGLIGRLAEIAAADGIDISEDALQAIASLADGGMRDAISLLDQAKSSFPAHISRDDILALAGVVQDEFMQQMAVALISGDAPALLELVDQLVMAGRDLARFITDLAQHLRNILVCQVSANPHLLVRASSETLDGMKQLASQISGDELVDLIKGLSALLSDLRWAADARTALEIGLIRLMATRTQPAAVKAMPAKAAASASTPVPPAAAPAVSAASPTSAVVSQAPSPAPSSVAQASQAAKPVPAPVAKESSSPAPVKPMVSDDQGLVPPPADDSFIDDDIPLPEPEPELVPQQEPRAAAKPAPEVPASQPVTSLSAAQTLPTEPASPQAEPLALDVSALWQKVQDQLLAEGQMTLYLFCRPVRPEIADCALLLHLAAADKVNYQEISHAASLKLLQSAARRVAGREMIVRPVLDGGKENARSSPEPAAPAADDWIDKIKKAGDTLGIPVKVEE